MQAQRELKGTAYPSTDEQTVGLSEPSTDPTDAPLSEEHTSPSTDENMAGVRDYLLAHDIPAGDADLISSIVRNASSGRNVYNELRKAFKKDWKRYYDVVKTHLAQKGEK